MTYQQQLDEINTAISAILTGAQEYSVSGRMAKKAQLDTLIKERQRLEFLVSQENNTSTRAYARWPTR